LKLDLPHNHGEIAIKKGFSHSKGFYVPLADMEKSSEEEEAKGRTFTD